jgi:hypothetical protein
MNMYLHAMTEADFGILDTMQGPIQTALSRLMDAGKIDQEASVELFRGLSEGLAKAASTGEMPTEILDRLRKTTGAYGKDLANLAEKQFKLAAATKAVKEAEEALERARTAQKDAQDNVANLADEYNALLAAGADPAVLAAKRAEFEAAKGQLAVADDQVAAAEMQNEEAQKQLEPLQEQVALQQKILDQMFKMTEPMTAVTDALTGALGKLAAGPPIEIPTPAFSSEGVANSLGTAFENAKTAIATKMAELFAPVREEFTRLKEGPIAEFLTTWETFTGTVRRFWDEKVVPVIDAIREFIPEGTLQRMGDVSGKLLLIGGAAAIVLGVVSLLTSPFFLLVAAITALSIIWEKWGPQVVEITTGLATLAGILADAVIAKVVELYEELRDGLFVWLEKVNTFVEDTLKPAWADFKDNYLQPLIDGFISLWTGIKDAVKWFGNLKDKIDELGGRIWDALKMFIGKSPSPLEKGLRGVANQMKQMSRYDIPSFSASLASMPALAVSPMGMGGGDTYNYNMEVSTRAETPSVVQDFEMLKFLARR